jgi:hypothetical protein
MSTDPRQAEAVRLTRLLLPLYGGLVLVLFAPVILRIAGGEVPSKLQAVVSLPTIAAMVVTLGWWFFRMTTLAQWKPGGGPRFSIAAAILAGTYEPTGQPPTEAPKAPPSPLGILATDVGEVEARLRDQPALAASLRAALREAEGLAENLAANERTATPQALARARAGLGRFEDHVVQLRKLLVASGSPGAEWDVTIEGDLVELRVAGDAVRGAQLSGREPAELD